MPTTIVCPGCGFVGHIDNIAEGHRVKCPRCQTVIGIRSTASSTEAPPQTVLDPSSGLHPSSGGRDDFFASLAYPRAGQAAATIDWLAGTTPSAELQAAAPQPAAPQLSAPADPQLERACLQKEREHVDVYVQERFERLRKCQQEIAAFNVSVETKLVNPQQELDRQQLRLQAREAALAEREAACSRLGDELARQQAQFAADHERQRSEAAAQSERWREQARDAREEYEAVTSAAAAQKAAAAEEEARIAARALELENRRLEVELAILAWRRRAGDLDETEAQLRRDLGELEKRRQQLADSEQAIERRSREVEELSRITEERASDLDRLQQALETAEREIEHRAALVEAAGQRVFGMLADAEETPSNETATVAT